MRVHGLRGLEDFVMLHNFVGIKDDIQTSRLNRTLMLREHPKSHAAGGAFALSLKI